MKYRTENLVGHQLDAAVAMASGLRYEPNALDGTGDAGWLVEFDDGQGMRVFSPSSTWADGGPIIERERIALVGWRREWVAAVNGFADIEGGITSEHGAKAEASGATALEAAMRAFVGWKLGGEIELPE